MRSNRLLLGIPSIGLVLGVLVPFTLAYGENEARHHEARDHEARDHAVVQKGVQHTVKLSNLEDKPLKDIDIKFSGKDAGDFAQTNDCGEKLAGKASCTITVTFAPKTQGNKAATMEIHTSKGQEAVSLTGTGT